MSLRSFARLGSSLSGLSIVHLGSSLSLRSFDRLGSAFSCLGVVRLGSSLSVLNFVKLGSSMSLRGFARLVASLAVADFVCVGSSLSLRSFARIGCTLALFGWTRFGSSLSLLNYVNLGAAISLRSFARLGSSLSVLDFVHIGSSLSLRSFGRFGSAVSVVGLARFGASLAVVDFVGLGSSLSLRSFATLGASISVLDFVHLGSTLSLRGFARVGSTLSVVGGTVKFGEASKLVFNSNQIDFYGGSNTAKGLAVTSTGGKLHGVWQADTTILTSDRRLKTDIRPLHEYLRQRMPRNQQTLPVDEGREGLGQWLLREIRPVSFRLKGGVEAKRLRFGFIADELERVLPEVVRTEATLVRKKGVIYNDLIAVLTTVVQSLNADLGSLKTRVRLAEEELARMDRADEEENVEDEIDGVNAHDSLQSDA